MAESAVKVQNLRCEYEVNPVGIDVLTPRLSWELQSDQRSQRQTAYQILVASTEDNLRKNQGDLWDSGKVNSDQSVHIPYSGKPLSSRQTCYWKVRVWDKEGKASDWSKPAYWEMALLHPSDWKAQWITFLGDKNPSDPTVGEIKPCPYLRKSFHLSKPVKRARFYATALGIYELHLNGKRVGDHIFPPGWTDYRKRVMYQTYDVTSLLKLGENAIGVILGDGWYAGFVGLGGRNRYGKFPLFLGQLEMEYTDGTTEVLTSDRSWKGSYGPILQSDMLMGETYDARQEIPNWDQPGFDDTTWKPVLVAKLGDQGIPSPQLVAQVGPPVRRILELRTQKVTEPSPGVFIFDLGQNMVGWARLKVKGPQGTEVTLRFAEMLNPDGTLYTANYRGAKCTDKYVLKGEGKEIYEPLFTFRGFRYVEVTGYPGKPGPEAITGVVVHSDTPLTGKFECSHPMINQLQHNILWGQRGNFLSVPTDCPQRDERLGWTGDAQIFARTAAFNMEVAGFFTKWMIDLEDAQSPEGAFPDVAPRVAAGEGTPAWGDAGVIIPWTVYQVYGDTRILERHYAAMAKWIDYLKNHSQNLIRPDAGYGDWLNVNAETPKDVLATAYFAYSTRLLSRIARSIGREAEAKKYEDLFQEIKKAFNQAFVKSDGRIKGDTQTAYVLALHFDLLPEEKRSLAVQYLIEDIQRRNGHLSTGFVGTAYLPHVLTQYGHLEVAYRLLNNDTFPSWLFMVKNGATTIWERWDGWTPDKGFQDPGMNSFNHYAFGSIGEWMYKTIAGISEDPEKPGFKHILIHPRPGGGLTSAKGEYYSLYGPILSEWKITNNHTFTLRISIPANSTATVYIPTADREKIRERGKPADQAEGVRFLRMEKGTAVYEVGSGEYQFTSPLP